MTKPTQEPERVLDEYLAVWNERDYSKIPDVVSESFVRTSPVTEGDVEGHEGFEEFLRALEAAFSDFRIDIEDRLVGENVAMSEESFTGTHDGEFEGVPPTEQEVEVTAMSKIRIEGGYVQEHRTYYDGREMFEQLGLESD